MAGQKGKSRRRTTARAPVIDVEATEITEKDAKSAQAEKKTPGTPAGTSKPITPDADTKPAAGKSADKSAGAKEAKPTASATPKKPQPDTPSDTGNNRSPKKASSWSGAKIASIGVLALAIAAGGAWLYREYGAAYFPSKTVMQQAQAIGDLSKRINALEGTSQKVATLGAELDEVKKQLAERAGKSTDVDLGPALEAAKTAETKADNALAQATAAQDTAKTASNGLRTALQEIASVKTAIDDAAKAIPDLNATTGDALKAAQMQISSLSLKVEDAIKRLNAQPQSDTVGEIAALSDTVSSLQTTVKSLSAAQQELANSAQKSATAEAHATAFAAALTQLRQKLASGAPFATQLEPISQAMPNDPAAKVLLSMATTGVPPTDNLISRFAAVEKALKATSAAVAPDASEQDQGLLARIQNRLGSIIKVRSAGTTDWAGLAERMAADAARGDLAAMVGHLDGISAPPPQALADWLTAARQRLSADSAVNQLAAAVMARAAASSKTGG